MTKVCSGTAASLGALAAAPWTRGAISLPDQMLRGRPSGARAAWRTRKREARTHEAMRQSLTSFAKVTDRRYLNVSPATSDVVKIPQRPVPVFKPSRELRASVEPDPVPENTDAG